MYVYIYYTDEQVIYVLYGMRYYDVMVFHIYELFTYMNRGGSQGVWISEGQLYNNVVESPREIWLNDVSTNIPHPKERKHADKPWTLANFQISPCPAKSA